MKDNYMVTASKALGSAKQKMLSILNSEGQ